MRDSPKYNAAAGPIRRHLEVYGDTNWQAFEFDAGVCRQVFRRYVRRVQDELANAGKARGAPVVGDKGERDPPKLKKMSAGEKPRKRPKAPISTVVRKSGESVPAAPTSRLAQKIAKEVGITPQDIAEALPIDFLGHVTLMLGHCDTLDDEAKEAKKDGGEAVKPWGLKDAVAARVSVLKLAIDGQERLFGLARVQLIHRLMMRRIAELEPAAARKIVGDLRKIDQEYGICLGGD